MADEKTPTLTERIEVIETAVNELRNSDDAINEGFESIHKNLTLLIERISALGSRLSERLP